MRPLPPVDVPPQHLAPFAATVELVEPMGSEIHLNMTAGGRNLIARVSPRFKPAIGQEIRLTADMSNAQLFDRDTERSILY